MGISVEAIGGKFLIKNIPVASVGVVEYKEDGSSCYRGADFMNSVQQQLLNKGVTFKHPKSLRVKGVESINDIKGNVLDTRFDGEMVYADITTQDGEIITQLEKLIKGGSPLHSSIGYTGVTSHNKTGEYKGTLYNKEFNQGIVNHLAICVDTPRDKTASGHITRVINDSEGGETIYETEENTEIQNPLINNSEMPDEVKSIDAGELSALHKKIAELESCVAESKTSNSVKDAIILELQKSLSEKEKFVNDSIEIGKELAEYKNKIDNQELVKKLESEDIVCSGIDIEKQYAENLAIAQASIVKATNELGLSKEDTALIEGIKVDSEDMFAQFKFAQRLVNIAPQLHNGSGVSYSKTHKVLAMQDTIDIIYKKNQ